jgi:uncharacterized RDD family membrane protein YckC
MTASRSRPTAAPPARANWELTEPEGAFHPREEGPSADAVYADVPRRAVAFVLDLVFIYVTANMLLQFLAFITGLTVLASLSTQLADRILNTWLGFGLPMLVVGVVQATVFVLFYRRYSASPAQLAFGLYTVRARDGEPLSVGRSIVRWLLALLPAYLITAASYVGVIYSNAIVPTSGEPTTNQANATGATVFLALLWILILLISALVDRRGRGLHDRTAGSVVVRPA